MRLKKLDHRLKDNKYETNFAGQWVKPKRKYYNLGCCDCGLVHKMEFKLKKYKNGSSEIWFRSWRDEEETKYLRKRDKIKIKGITY